MPLPVIPGTVRTAVGGLIEGGGRWSNTWHARRIDLAEPDAGELAALAVVLLAFYGAVVLPKCPDGTTLTDLDMTPLDGTSGATHVPGGLVGAQASATLPAEVAEVLTIRTAGRGRRARGRVYLPSFTTDSFDAVGHIGAVVSAGIVTAALAMEAAAVVAGWNFGVASYGSSRKINFTTTPKTYVVTTWAPFFTPVTGFSMDQSADVIRGRKT